MKPKFWSFVVGVALAAAAAVAGQPELVNEKRVFPKDEPVWKTPPQSYLWAMRLSPDGTKLLYPRPKGPVPLTPEGAPDRRRAQYELVLRDLGSAKETVLPLRPLESGWRTGFTRFNMFDPAGQRLALLDIEVKRERLGEHGERVRTHTKVVLYDVRAAKLVPTELEGARTFAKFDRAGTGLIGTKGLGLFTATLPTVKIKPLKAKGFPNSVCPAADVICVWAPGVRLRRRPGQRPERGPQRLFLYDLKADKEIAKLPVHRRNSSLDDLETQWTADGRYLYYYDVEEVLTDAPGRSRPKLRRVARIWDRTGGKQAGRILDATPVGHGPGPSTMVLAKRTDRGSEGFLLHDARTDAMYRLAGPPLKLIHAAGSMVVYAKPLPDKTEAAHVAVIGGL